LLLCIYQVIGIWWVNLSIRGIEKIDMTVSLDQDQKFMEIAVDLALLAENEGNLPVGAVIVLKGEVISEGRSRIKVPHYDATRHAEMEAIRSMPQDLWGFSDELVIYTTLEPCLMCFGAILLHRIRSVVFGADDKYGGASTAFSCLPPFFNQQLKKTEWVGPIMPVICRPLLRRLLEIEGVEPDW
jgi:tRNA(adenine34) deaminase